MEEAEAGWFDARMSVDIGNGLVGDLGARARRLWRHDTAVAVQLGGSSITTYSIVSSYPAQALLHNLRDSMT